MGKFFDWLDKWLGEPKPKTNTEDSLWSTSFDEPSTSRYTIPFEDAPQVSEPMTQEDTNALHEKDEESKANLTGKKSVKSRKTGSKKATAKKSAKKTTRRVKVR